MGRICYIGFSNIIGMDVTKLQLDEKYIFIDREAREIM